jgi:hypothetical protein
MTNLEGAIRCVSATAVVLNALLPLLDEATASQPVDDGWSPKDVVAHLILTDRTGWLARIRLMQAEELPLLPVRDEEEELRSSGLRSQQASDLIARFTAERGENVAWLRSLRAEAFAKRGRHSEVGEVTAGEMLFHGAYHDALHLRQLLAMVQTFFEPRRGPMRAY